MKILWWLSSAALWESLWEIKTYSVYSWWMTAKSIKWISKLRRRGRGTCGWKLLPWWSRTTSKPFWFREVKCLYKKIIKYQVLFLLYYKRTILIIKIVLKFTRARMFFNKTRKLKKVGTKNSTFKVQLSMQGILSNIFRYRGRNWSDKAWKLGISRRGVTRKTNSRINQDYKLKT